MNCKNCGDEMDPLDEFPGQLDLKCYAATQENAPLPTAQELARMWGAK